MDHIELEGAPSSTNDYCQLLASYNTEWQYKGEGRGVHGASSLSYMYCMHGYRYEQLVS